MNAPMRVDRPRAWQVSSRWFAAALLAATASSSCSDRLVLGDQCPSPELSESAPGLDGGSVIYGYGTSCAPCDREPELDDQGCPVYVTFESCGGPICIGNIMLPVPTLPSDEDAGEPQDSGMSQEDGGAD
jgi:hypothetical protein